MENWTEYSRFFIALLVILDPFAAVPLFITLTRSYSKPERKHIALIASFTVMVVLLLTALTGEKLLHTLGTSLASFRVGGGLILLLMALAMLRAQPQQWRTTSDEASEAESKSSIAVVPLAIPLLAGPGSISTVIIEVHRYSGVVHFLLVAAIIILVCILLWLVLRLAVPIGNALGQIGLNIVNRLFGLILAAIAVEIMANGFRALFPILAG